ncbi:Hypothetical protein CINCED_3A013557 [Cinara cedri]|uniref:Uncharacterized protein n=1 Tax=Cinara cedri TaxID=506608 RepID=A0A5E4MLJ2_9HEMI|nr:Hypothetical protein CINCED_3A013557 [Cinara cedri]
MDGLTQTIIYDTKSPPNIYSTTVMRMVDGNEKIIMVSSKTDIITLETKTVNDEPITSIVPIEFSNIPNNAAIIAIHCINKSKEFDDFIIGITYEILSDEEENQSEVYFNNYMGFPGSSLEAIISNCETLKLNFFPLQLNHSIYLCENQKKGMWLLSGNDRKIHAYKSDKQQICEQKVHEYFVEYQDIKYCIISFSIKSFSDYKKRISFYGCDKGYSVFTIVDSEKNQILQRVETNYQSTITAVQLFNIHNRTYTLENIISAVKDIPDIPDYETINEKEPVCLLVGSILESAVVYMDVLKNHLRKRIKLPNTDEHQIIATSLIADINFDSKNEILLGTTDNYILNYVYKDNIWIEQQQYDLRYPVFTISYLDITNQGVKDAVVMTERGIHILKHEPKDVIEVLKYRFEIEHHNNLISFVDTIEA